VRNRPIDLLQPVTAVDHSRGPEHAPVVVVEYGDFQCPNCKQAAPAVQILLRDFPDHVRFVYRHYPLEEVHPHALQAAEAVESAGGQGKFWEMHEQLFAHQNHLDLRHLRRYAAEIGLDLARYTAEMDDHVYLQRIREHLDGGRRSGVRGTPGFFVNGVITDVSFGLESLFDATRAVLRNNEP
jgi:protein-disulfide isomerase